MSTRDQLRSRDDVANEDVDAIIEEAARLQDEERAATEGPTRQEVRDVAEELDIDPAYVDAAIGSLAERRAADEAAAERKAVADAEQSAATRSMVLMAGGGLAVVGLLGLLLAGGLAASAASGMTAADDAYRQAEANLVVVQQRQATLAPQLVALAGGDGTQLTRQAAALQAANTPAERAKASDALGLAMASALGRLPPATDPATAQSRADLQHEVSGTTNRITVESRRVAEAQGRVDASHRGLGATLASTFGLHSD